MTAATTPSSTAIAIPILISGFVRTPSRVQLEFTRGCFWRTRATTAISRSVCVSFTPCNFSVSAPRFCLASFRAPASTSRVTKKWGTVVQLCVVRSAISRAIGLPVSTAAGDGAALDSAAARMSEARISPPAPDPRTSARLTPRSLARRRARNRRGRENGGGLSSRLDGDFIHRRNFAGTDDPSDGLAYGHFGSSLDFDAGKDAVTG